MGAIFLHQLRENLISLRFQISLVILLMFFGANGVIYTMKTGNLADEVTRITRLNEERYGRVETTADAASTSYKIRCAEVGTEFMAEAGSDWFRYAMYVNPGSGEIPGFASSRTTNRWMRRFEVVDWAVIVRYVLSFLCVVLAYNAVCGERENGTLLLVLTNSLSRGRFLLAKVGAHLATLLAATLAGSLLSLLILVLGGVLEPDGEVWLSYAFFLLGTTVFITLFLLLSTGISALARSSASSLVLLVTAWTVLMVVIPQTSYLAAVTAVKSPGGTWQQIDTHEREVRTALQREGIEPRPPELARADDFALEKRYAQRIQEMEKGKDRIRLESLDQEIRQFEVARTVNMLSPGFAFQYSLEALLRNGIERFRSFTRQGWDYRETLRDFLRARDAADPDSPHVLFLGDYMSQEKLDPRHIPRFEAVPLPLGESVAAGLAPILVLVLETALAFFFALWAFNRAEAAG